MGAKKKRPTKNQQEWERQEARVREFIKQGQKKGYNWKSDIIPKRPNRITEKSLQGIKALTPAELIRRSLSEPEELKYLPQAKDIIQTRQLPTSTLSGKTEYKNFDFTPADVKGFNDIEKLYYKEAKRILRFYQNAENKGYFWNDADKFYPKNPKEATAEDLELIKNLHAESLYQGAEFFEYDENNGGNGIIVTADEHARNIRREAAKKRIEAQRQEQERKQALHEKRVEAAKKGWETRKKNEEARKQKQLEEQKQKELEEQKQKELEEEERKQLEEQKQLVTQQGDRKNEEEYFPVFDIEEAVREMLENLRQHELSNSRYYIDISGDSVSVLISAFNDRVEVAQENGTYTEYTDYLQRNWDTLQSAVDDALMTSDGNRKQQDFARLMEILTDGAVTMEEAQAVEDLAEYYADTFELY